MNISGKLKLAGRILAAAAVSGAAVLLAGCVRNDPPSISVSDPMLIVGVAGGDLGVRVISNTEWQATGAPDWITLSASEGRGSTTLTLTVDPYDASVVAGRQATITFTTRGSDRMTATVVVDQGDTEAVLAVSPPYFITGVSGGRIFFEVTSNVAWTLAGDYDWIDVVIDDEAAVEGRGNALVTLVVDEYEAGGAPREARFTVSEISADDPLSESFTLTQTGLASPSLVLGQAEINFPATVDPQTVPRLVPVITSLAVSKPVLDIGPSWCSAEVAQAGGVWYVEIAAADNTAPGMRSGVVTVTIPSVDDSGNALMQQIRVTQDGVNAPGLEILSPVVNIASDVNGDSVAQTVGYISGVPVAIYEWPEWVSSVKADGVGTITLVAEPNLHQDMREGTIAVVATAGGYKTIRTISVIQRGLGEFSVSATPSTLDLPASMDNPSDQRFTVYTHTSVAGVASPTIMQVDGNWLTWSDPVPVNTTVGTAYSIELAYTANSRHSARTGTVQMFWIVGSQSYTSTLNISQDGVGGPSIVVIPPFANIPNTVGSTLDLILQNAEFAGLSTVVSPGDWLTASVASDRTRITLTVAAANPDTATRTATLFVIAEQGGAKQIVEVEIHQHGTGGAAMDIPKNTYETGMSAASFDVPVLALNGSAVELTGYNPADMFAVAPTLSAGSVNIKITENTGTSQRIAEVVLLATNGSDHQFYYISVIQEGAPGPQVMVASDQLTIPSGAVTASVYDIALFNVTGTTNEYTVLSGNSEFVTGEIDGDDILRITLVSGPNAGISEKSATVRVVASSGGLTSEAAVEVTQPHAGAPEIVMGANSMVFGAPAQADQALYFANHAEVDVAVTSKPNWITTVILNEGTADGAGSYKFNVAANQSAVQRSGEIVLSATSGDQTVHYPVGVIQNASSPLNVMVVPSTVYANFTAATLADVVAVAGVPVGATVTVTSLSQSWLTAGGLTGAPPDVETFRLTVTENTTKYPRVGTVLVKVARGGEVQWATVSVMQYPENFGTGTGETAIYPATHSVVFPAEAGGASSASLIEIVGFDSANYTFTYTQSTDWFTVVPPSSPMRIYPKTSLAGANARTGQIYITVTSKSDPGDVVAFTVNVSQESPAGVNIGYAPSHHTVGQEGTSLGLEPRTLFANPEDITLEVASGLDPNFVSAATWTTAGKEIAFTVRPNPGADSRTSVVNIVAKVADNQIGVYPVTVFQDGVSASAPTVVAQFVSANAVVYGSGTGIEALMHLESGVTLTGATPVVPTPAWLKNVAFNATSTPYPKVTYDIDSTAADYPEVAGQTSSAQIVATISVGGKDYDLYYTVTTVAQSMPVIGATLTTHSGIISAATTSARIVFADDKGTGTPPAVITLPDAATDIQYAGAAGWLDGAVFSLSGSSPGRSIAIASIPANTTTVDRSAVITIRLTQPAHQDQTLVYVLTQKGIPTIGASYSLSYVAEYNATRMIIAPLGNVNGGIIIDDPLLENSIPQWVTGHSVSGAVLTLDFPQNLGNIPNRGDIEFTLKKAGYEDQHVNVIIMQMPPSGNTLLTINPATILAWTPGSTGSVSYTDEVGGTTVTVFTYDALFALVATPTSVSVAGATGTFAITAAKRNVSGARQSGNIMLKAVNGSLTEWYEVTVYQNSAASSDLIPYFFFTGNDSGGSPHGITNVAKNGANITCNVNMAFPITGPDSAFIYVSADSLVGDYTATFAEVNDSPNNFWDPGSSNPPTWDASARNMIVWRRGWSAGGSGTSNYRLTVTVGSVSAAFNIAITR